MSSRRLLVLALVLASFFAISAVSAQPTFYETTLTLATPPMNEEAIDTVIFRWSTTATAGSLGEENLQDCTMKLLSDGLTVYEDVILIDGVPQPFGGEPRLLDSDVFWDYDLDSLTLFQMRNISWETAQMSSGTQFYIGDGEDLITDSTVDVLRYDDGVEGITYVETLTSQRTAQVLFGDGFESGDASAWSTRQP